MNQPLTKDTTHLHKCLTLHYYQIFRELYQYECITTYITGTNEAKLNQNEVPGFSKIGKHFRIISLGIIALQQIGAQ
jgi:hypothetical protein